QLPRFLAISFCNDRKCIDQLAEKAFVQILELPSKHSHHLLPGMRIKIVFGSEFDEEDIFRYDMRDLLSDHGLTTFT
ncbi:hypothetical protein DBR33_07620, partial [Stenotrophomonas sp. HMWF022]